MPRCQALVASPHCPVASVGDRDPGAVAIRRASVRDAGSLRVVRLRALRDSPAAFAATLAAEAERPDSDWLALAAESEIGEAEAVFLAGDGEPDLGMAAARWFDRDQGIVALWGMWVDPTARRRRIGERLVAEVHDWAARRGAARVRLGVIEAIAGAQEFYLRLGYARTGETKPLLRDERIRAVFLSRPV